MIFNHLIHWDNGEFFHVHEEHADGFCESGQRRGQTSSLCKWPLFVFLFFRERWNINILASLLDIRAVFKQMGLYSQLTCVSLKRWQHSRFLRFTHIHIEFLLNTPIFSVKTKSFLDTPTASDAWRIFSDEKKRSQSICVHRPCLLWASHEEPRVWGEGKALVIPSICGLGDEWLFTPALKQLARPRDILSLAHLYRQQPLQIRFQRCAVAYDSLWGPTFNMHVSEAPVWSFWLILVSLKGTVHPKIIILWSFTHYHAIPNLEDILKDTLKTVLSSKSVRPKQHWTLIELNKKNNNHAASDKSVFNT